MKAKIILEFDTENAEVMRDIYFGILADLGVYEGKDTAALKETKYVTSQLNITY